MLVVRLPEEYERRLERLAQATGRSKSFYARELFEEHLDEIEDRYMAERRLEKPQKPLSAKQARKALGLDA